MNKETTQFRIGLITLMIISLHVLLCLYFAFAPGRYAIRNGLAIVYRNVALLGPFFTESRIKASPYLVVRTNKDGVWSSARYVYKDHLSAYNNLPWRLHELSHTSNESRLTRELSEMKKLKSADDIKSSTAFRALHAFLTEDTEADVDSIQIASGMAYYNPETRSFFWIQLFS